MNHKQIFIPVVGEFANVGDVMHRAELLRWLKSCGKLYVYVGKAPQDFVHGLELPDTATVYSSISRWLIALLFAPIGKAHFVFNSGEITVSSRRLILEFVLLPFLLITKLKGGKILRIGVAAASNIGIRFISLWRFLFRLSTLVMWRTNVSRDLFNVGEVIPDLAFAGKEPVRRSDTEAKQLRKNLIVSMRWDRPYPNSDWLQGVKDFALRYNLNIMVVSQVRKDNATCERLAADLGGEAVIWNDNVFHLSQEDHLRKIYQESLLAISDRLHVLIAAITEGVLPSVILTKPSNKVEHHFDVVGLQDVSINTTNYVKMKLHLERQVLRRHEVFDKLTKAQEELRVAQAKVQRVLGFNTDI